MHLGLRPRVPFPASYRGWGLVRTHGRIFALPKHVDPLAALRTGRLILHPEALSAATLDEVKALIDDSEARPRPPANDAEREPREAGRDGVPVEFAGWLPVYEWSGNCGSHPQFNHTAEPPPGYCFTCSAPAPAPFKPQDARPSPWGRTVGRLLAGLRRVPATVASLARFAVTLVCDAPHVSIRDRLRLLGALARFAVSLLLRGAGPEAVWRFVQSRHFRSQLLLAPQRGPVFLTSMPYTFGQNPWVIEIEDPTTLFYPFVQNGGTCGLRIAESPYFPIVKALLESDQCKGIVTHVRSTADLVPTLFGSDAVRRKVYYTPLGVKVPSRRQRHRDRDGDQIHLLFINSWCQVPENFYVRGGLDILEAFAVLRERYPQLRLTLRTALPDLDAHYHRILEGADVRVINRFLSAEEMSSLHADSHIFLLPAARIHIVSLLQAMSYGLAVVGSDGWGMEEYLRHEQNGLVVKGRYGKTSWADETAGLLREDYEPMYTPDPEVVAGLVEAVSRLVEDRELRRRLSAAARRDVETTYNLECWNAGLKAALDEALGNEPPCVASGRREPAGVA